ncbi:MAG TPA: hypothetical protein VMV43_03430 [Candidatus Nanopelagicaceae bacterium]|nr:hypothetical protein [Candidatus Nanopelagicaceae bacterium]
MENIDNNETVLIKILEIVKKLILEPRTDISWSTFDSKDELIFEIDTHIQKLKLEDFSKVKDIILLFAPTSDFQEISLSSGWSNHYLNISERFDIAIRNLCEKFQLKPFFDK